MCVNPKIGSVFTTEDETQNELWYNAVQRSFYEHQKEKNLIWRFRNETNLKNDYVADKAINSTDYVSDGNVILDIEEAYSCISSLYLGEDHETAEITVGNDEGKEPTLDNAKTCGSQQSAADIFYQTC